MGRFSSRSAANIQYSLSGQRPQNMGDQLGTLVLNGKTALFYNVQPFQRAEILDPNGFGQPGRSRCFKV
jgi:hypothetical protein